MRVEGGPIEHWEGLPLTRTPCDYNEDELEELFTGNFCMGLPPPALSRTLSSWGYRPSLGNLPSGQRRRVPSKDMREHQLYQGPHMRKQSSFRHQFDEDVPTYQSTSSSVMHGPVQRGAPIVFGGRGRTPQRDFSPSQARDMPPPSQLPFRFRPRTPSRPPPLSGPIGPPGAGTPFTGVPLGPQLLPPVLKKSPPTGQGWGA